MSKVIIYKQPSGVLAIAYPTQEAIDKYGIEAIALKDVPAGFKFKIIDESELPSDWSKRDQWTIDDEHLTDGVGSEFNTFEEILK